MTTLSIPLRTVPGLNAREHWCVRAKRVAQERRAVALVALAWRQPGGLRETVGAPPYRVTLTRVGPRLCDSDNLSGALKAVRDEVAALLGHGDGPNDPISWHYAQERGPWAVRVRIEGAEVAA